MDRNFVFEWKSILKDYIVVLQQKVKGLQNIVFHLKRDQQVIHFQVS